ncbi:MAG: O-Antigen ligase [Betaproteobacteria bacterium ADurb.Bin341]|nr:MAG: O-Antigen ligase [Betaproteobacteria bacterium ADurb.Bin341]
MRLDFYGNSLGIIIENPVYGVGTGGFAKAYVAKAGPAAFVYTDNPHNEYLLLAVQLGLMGPLLLGALFVVAWKAAARLSPRDQHLLRALVVAMAGGCLFNSFLYDFTEGLFFAWAAGVLCSGLSGNVDKKTRPLQAA